MVDAHCHLQEFDNPENVIKGLEAVICCGGGTVSSAKAVEIANRLSNVWATVGVHPEESGDVDKDRLGQLVKNPRVVAIGECGLDYYENTTETEKKFQKELLEFNVNLAEEAGLPLVVHCRNAFEDIFYGINYDKVQMHCFTGNTEQMEECIKRGWYVTFGGIITFKKSEYLREVVKKVPDNKFLIETDAPYLAPEPVRGSINIPENVKIVAKMVADLRNVSIEKIDEITSKNAKTLFCKI